MNTIAQATISGPVFGKEIECEAILRALPEWFGIEDSIANYVKKIKTLPTFIARYNNEVVGFISLKIHFDRAAEMYVLGILPKYHRKGIGRRLVDAATAYLCGCDIKFLQVKTLSESRDSEHYTRTRRFYESMGFQPLEEFKTLWDERNPCLLMIKSISDNTI